MNAIPPMKEYVMTSLLGSYAWAAGSKSVMEIVTIIPPTTPNSTAKAVGVIVLANTSQPKKPPRNSANAEIDAIPNPFHRDPVE